MEKLTFKSHKNIIGTASGNSLIRTTRLYPAGSLHDKHWIGLMHNLQAKGVHVRDELNLEKQK